jgi:alanyl aminopeptidase
MTPTRSRRCLAGAAAALAMSIAPLASAGVALAADVPPRVADIHRLPTDVTPTFQSIRLTLDPDKPDYTGTVRVELRVAKPVEAILFHAQDMKLESVVLRGKKSEVTLQPEVGAEGLVTARAPAPIAPGSYALEIAFQNEFDRRSTGLYRLETEGRFYAFTQFEAVEARTAFPCWDEPSFKFPYQITVVVPAKHEAVSNTPVETAVVKDGTKTVVFRRTKPLPSYLLALATGELEFVPVPGTSIPTRIVTVKGATEWSGTAVSMTPPILAALEKYFGGRYPYEKLDLIAVPEFTYGAMENPGAITYGDRFLLFDPRTLSTAERRRFAAFTAHELSHIWFGDVVTMKWWDDLWLNESFASWLGDKITGEVYPDLMIEETVLAGTQRAMALDALLSTRAIRQPITTMSNLLQSADQLAYNKGQAVLGMFEQWLGPETFRRGVLAYLKKHEWGNATASDLWGALSQASGRDVAGAMSTFLDMPGVPLVSADPRPDGSVRLSQRRFLNFGTEAPAAGTWKIPVRLEYFDGERVRTKSVLLTGTEMTVPLDAPKAPVWVHPNAGEAGYYRWSVPPEVLHQMAGSASERLTPSERVGFIYNSTALLDAGVIHGNDYLRLVESFADDPKPEVIGALPGPLRGVLHTFVTPDVAEPFAAYVRRVLGPALDRYGFDRAPGEAEAVSLVRPQLVGWMGDEGRDESVLARAEAAARSFMADRSAVDPSLISTTLALSAIRGDQALFDQYRARFEESTVPTDRTKFLEALGNFRAAELRHKALSYALTGPLRPHEILTIPRVMQEQNEFQEQVFDWMTANYETITSKVPPVYVAYMPYIGLGCDARRLERQKAFFSIPAHVVPGTGIELARVAETTEDCVGLRAREGASVVRYLSQLAVAK